MVLGRPKHTAQIKSRHDRLTYGSGPANQPKGFADIAGSRSYGLSQAKEEQQLQTHHRRQVARHSGTLWVFASGWARASGSRSWAWKPLRSCASPTPLAACRPRSPARGCRHPGQVMHVPGNRMGSL